MTKLKTVMVLGVLASTPGAMAQSFIRPAEKVTETSFAVITDPVTYSQCADLLAQYQTVLGGEGLPTTIVYHDWKNPEQVKKVIQKLYKKDHLEGVMLLGEVPVPMIRKAQHMTSAFKMDEKAHPYRDSSVPSDRFYDDFHLEFDFLKRDSVESQFFYYDLAPDSPQLIQCDIYSARVRAIDNGEDAATQYHRFFNKAIAEHQADNALDQFFSYTGHGSYSNSLTAWSPEAFTLREQMPGVFDTTGRARFIRHNFSDYPKDDVINMIKRDDLDLTIFHEHGVPERQYLSGIPGSNRWNDHVEMMKYNLRAQARRQGADKEGLERLKARIADKYGMDSTWIAGYDDPSQIAADSLLDARTGLELAEITEIKPNSRMVIFDACYNGDFREKDYIAGRYIMADGKTVTTFANTVNVLQDKMANELLGLLGMGARVGQWARLTNILESHITGDPTLRFKSAYDVDASQLLNAPYDEATALDWLQSPYPDIQSMALHTLYRNNYPGISDLLYDTYLESPYMMVRYACVELLEKLNDENFRKVLLSSINDSYEFIRRTTVRMMMHVGLPDYAYPMVKAYIDDNLSERVAFNVLLGLHTLDEQAVANAIDKVLAESFVQNADEFKKMLLNADSRRSQPAEILSDETALRWRKLYCNSMKNLMSHPNVDGFIALLNDSAQPEELKTSLLQALAWFNYSYRKDDLIDQCDRMRKDKNLSKGLRGEAERTYYRLKS